jgi:hypothetical protein
MRGQETLESIGGLMTDSTSFPLEICNCYETFKLIGFFSLMFVAGWVIRLIFSR